MHKFGGGWTQDKLERVRKYLAAYAQIMSKKHFRFAYIDAFAGTGYVQLPKSDPDRSLLLPLFTDQEAKGFIDGSARIALKIQPNFHRYIFIEMNSGRIKELGRLKIDFPHLAQSIQIIQADANSYLTDLCRHSTWVNHRAVLFLDPYGMQIRWNTLEAIASTKAIDLWILFPLGVAVNRLLRKDANISHVWQARLDELFGNGEWRKTFYQKQNEPDLFGDREKLCKTSDFKAISDYYVHRLKTIFPGVAENPLPLCNSKNVPLFLLCFASGNRIGAPTAIKIAQDILRGKNGK